MCTARALPQSRYARQLLAAARGTISSLTRPFGGKQRTVLFAKTLVPLRYLPEGASPYFPKGASPYLPEGAFPLPSPAHSADFIAQRFHSPQVDFIRPRRISFPNLPPGGRWQPKVDGRSPRAYNSRQHPLCAPHALSPTLLRREPPPGRGSSIHPSTQGLLYTSSTRA